MLLILSERGIMSGFTGTNTSFFWILFSRYPSRLIIPDLFKLLKRTASWCLWMHAMGRKEELLCCLGILVINYSLSHV